MKYGIMFLSLGIILGLEACLLRGLGWLLVWPCLSFGLVGLGYLSLGPGVFGKHPDGTMAWYSVVVLLPFLLLAWCTWHLVRQFSSEDSYHEVASGFFIGRRPLPGEVPDEVTLIVDLTAEFPERYGVRTGREYISFPILDTGTTNGTAFRSLVQRIVRWDGPVYIHCAMGHGRTGMVATAVLLAKGSCQTVEEAVLWLRTIRPRLELGKAQMAFLQHVSGAKNSDA